MKDRQEQYPRLNDQMKENFRLLVTSVILLNTWSVRENQDLDMQI